MLTVFNIVEELKQIYPNRLPNSLDDLDMTKLAYSLGQQSVINFIQKTIEEEEEKNNVYVQDT